MGIQGLLQALKPYVEPVHVNKYSGQRVGIDAYSWLHKGAYGCSWQQLRGDETQHNGGKLPPYVTYCMHRIKMLQYNNITPVVVFDGGRLPLKALTEQSRRRTREENLQKAHEKLEEGDILSAQDHFQKAVEITPLMAHELVKVLRDEGIEYVVAPYEADAQLAHLARLIPEEGGVTTIITEDSDLLAYGCRVVLFKMDKFGNGEEISLQRLLHSHPPPANAISFRNFTQDLFLAMCVLAGCDFLASIPGIGVKKAHALVAKYRNISRVLDRLKFLKHSEFPEGYITNFWQAKAIFTHARVYERSKGGLILLSPVPAELLETFDGDVEFLGPDLPLSRARAIAEGQLDPTTMCSFDALPIRTSTSSSMLETLSMKPLRVPKEELFSTPKQEPTWSRPWTESLQTVPITSFPVDDHYLEEAENSEIEGAKLEPDIDSRSTLTSITPPEIDKKLLCELQHIAYFGTHEARAAPATPDVQLGVKELTTSWPGYYLPKNNPFKRHRIDDDAEHPDSLASSQVPEAPLDCAGDSDGLCIGNSYAFSSPAEESQVLSNSGEAQAESVSIQSFDGVPASGNCGGSSPMSSPPLVVCQVTTDQRLPKQNASYTKGSDNRIFQASQTSVDSSYTSVLTDISPNIASAYPLHDCSLTKTPSTQSSRRSMDPEVQSAGKISLTKAPSQLRKSKSTSHSAGAGKRSRVHSFSQSRPAWEGGILRFFKPIPTPRKLTLKI